MRLRRPRPIVALVAAVVTLALLCCGGSVTALFLGVFNADKSNPAAFAGGCGHGGPVNPDGKLPSIHDYGPAQIRNAAIIINTGAELKLPPRAWVIAIATAMQESGLTNLGDLGARNDHDSLGLFQQRPSTGWGTPKQVTDPAYASMKFYQKLKTIKGWQNMPLTEAAQKVQISAYPDAYAKHEPAATEIVNELAHGAGNAAGNSLTMVCAAAGQIAASGWTVPVKGAVVGDLFRTAQRPKHNGVDLIVPRYTPIMAAASGVVSRVKCDPDSSGQLSCNEDGHVGKGGCGWMVEIVHAGNVMSRYCHMVVQPFVKVGQEVQAGQVIGKVGMSGNASGPHLHFEVHLNDDRSSAGATNPMPFMKQHGAALGGSG